MGKHIQSFNEHSKVNESASKFKIIYPTSSEVEKILDGWSDRHEECWDYDADRSNVEIAINAYQKLIIEINK